MSVVILDHCPSCGKCSRPGVCPTDAIKVENGKTFVGQGCIDCGLCIPVCPIGIIVQAESAKEEVTPQPEPTVPDGEEGANGTESTSTGA